MVRSAETQVQVHKTLVPNVFYTRSLDRLRLVPRGFGTHPLKPQHAQRQYPNPIKNEILGNNALDLLPPYRT